MAKLTPEQILRDLKEKPTVPVDPHVCWAFGCSRNKAYEMAHHFAHRGNNSQTLQYEAGKRFAKYIDQGFIPLVLHLADHDPNGIDMTRDNRERLTLYARAEIEVRRIALTMKQVRRYRPPPSFIKEGDTRTTGYRERFGTDECWELDAPS